MISSDAVNWISASVVPSFWLNGPTNSVQVYCGLEIAIMAITPSTSCHQRVRAVSPLTMADEVMPAPPVKCDAS